MCAETSLEWNALIFNSNFQTGIHLEIDRIFDGERRFGSALKRRKYLLLVLHLETNKFETGDSTKLNSAPEKSTREDSTQLYIYLKKLNK